MPFCVSYGRRSRATIPVHSVHFVAMTPLGLFLSDCFRASTEGVPCRIPSRRQ